MALLKEFALKALMTREEYASYLIDKTENILKKNLDSSDAERKENPRYYYRSMGISSAQESLGRLVNDYMGDAKVQTYLLKLANRELQMVQTSATDDMILELADKAFEQADALAGKYTPETVAASDSLREFGEKMAGVARQSLSLTYDQGSAVYKNVCDYEASRPKRHPQTALALVVAG